MNIENKIEQLEKTPFQEQALFRSELVKLVLHLLPTAATAKKAISSLRLIADGRENLASLSAIAAVADSEVVAAEKAIYDTTPPAVRGYAVAAAHEAVAYAVNDNHSIHDVFESVAEAIEADAYDTDTDADTANDALLSKVERILLKLEPSSPNIEIRMSDEEREKEEQRALDIIRQGLTFDELKSLGYKVSDATIKMVGNQKRYFIEV